MSGAVDDGSIAELDGVAPGKVDVAGAQVITRVNAPFHNADEQITVGCLEDGNSLTDQGSLFLAGRKADFAVASVLPQMRCGSFQRERRRFLGRKVDGP